MSILKNTLKECKEKELLINEGMGANIDDNELQASPCCIGIDYFAKWVEWR